MKLILASLLCLCAFVAALPLPQDEDMPPMPVRTFYLGCQRFNQLDNELHVFTMNFIVV